MPERPDLEYVVPILARELRGQTIVSVTVAKPVVLRMTVVGTPTEVWTGMTFGAVQRRGHFVVFDLDRAEATDSTATGQTAQLVVSPMLAGRFTLLTTSQRARKDVAVSWDLSDGRRLCYRDDEQMGKVYAIEQGAWQEVPGLSNIGVDVLDDTTFTLERFMQMAAKRRDQVRVFLMDKTAIDSLGNAYADEVLWEAEVHPKTFVRKLSPDALESLHRAIVKVLSEAREEIAHRQPALDEKVRDFLKVRNKHGQPCPRCGTKIRRAGVRGYDAFFCPRCQRDSRGSSIVDWGKVPKS